ncbi:DUF6303 family protein [Streptomyces sp. NPDC016566]|uniref:DUF6303 family protein n=1 Tax=Streptomyces sp. NPDC016566 TaxID=3364967 RepID=UPI0036F6F159
MAEEYRAHLAHCQAGEPAEWWRYVEVPGADVPWLEHGFGPAERVPTFTRRAETLTALGFVQAPDAEWEWTEFHLDRTDPAAPVWLLASVQVRSRTEGDA